MDVKFKVVKEDDAFEPIAFFFTDHKRAQCYVLKAGNVPDTFRISMNGNKFNYFIGNFSYVSIETFITKDLFEKYISDIFDDETFVVLEKNMEYPQYHNLRVFFNFKNFEKVKSDIFKMFDMIAIKNVIENERASLLETVQSEFYQNLILNEKSPLEIKRFTFGLSGGHKLGDKNQHCYFSIWNGKKGSPSITRKFKNVIFTDKLYYPVIRDKYRMLSNRWIANREKDGLQTIFTDTQWKIEKKFQRKIQYGVTHLDMNFFNELT